jgi:hypothetical protein
MGWMPSFGNEPSMREKFCSAQIISCCARAICHWAHNSKKAAGRSRHWPVDAFAGQN